MNKELKWGLAIFIILGIGYIPGIGTYASKLNIFGVPFYPILLIIQTVIILAILIYVGKHAENFSER